MPIVDRSLTYTLTVLGLLVASGCATSRPFHTPDAVTSSNEAVLLNQLQEAITPWLGTPYQLGGSTTEGVDCSAFVAAVYRDVFSRSLPRTTRAQVRRGRPVPRRRLMPGDLLFFKPPGNVDHVGIYLTDHRFAHAATSEGVTVSSLSETYWNRAFWTARRLVPRNNSPSSEMNSTVNPSSGREAKRTAAGW